MATDEELEDVWNEVRPSKAIKVVRNHPLNIHEALKVASAKTTFKMQPRIQELDGKHTTIEILAELIVATVKTFLECWLEELKGHDLAGLLSIILEGQDMTPDELKEFVEAIPISLLERICASSVGAYATGVHALMGIEVVRRLGRLREYKLKKDIDGVLIVSFQDDDRMVEVRLDEHFKVD